MTTARTVITDSTKLLNVWQKGEVLDDDEAVDGLRRLNQMIDSWSNESLMLFQLIERSKALTAGTASYTIGSAGVINTTRPVRIESAFIRDSSSNDYKLEIITNDEWAKISRKSTVSTIPSVLYYRANCPLGVINLHEAPEASLTLYMECWDQLDQMTIDSVVALPPGYERALTYNLAVEQAPMYGKEPSQIVMKIAAESKIAIMETNDINIPILENPFSCSGSDSDDLFN